MELPDLLEDNIDSYAELAFGRSNFYFFLSSVFLKPPTTDIIKMLTELTNSPESSNFVSKQTADSLSRMGIINNEQVRLPLAATFKLPSRKRGWGCVAENLHTPLSPLFRGESQKIEIPVH